MGTRPAFTSSAVLSAFVLAVGLAGVTPSLAARPALPIPVFNSGVDAAGVPLPGGSIDPHYTLVTSADPAFPGPKAYVSASIAEGYWLPNSEISKWISPSPAQNFPDPVPCNPAGTYTYRTTFDLRGLDPATATLTGYWAADSLGSELLLNGVATGYGTASYNDFGVFTLSSGFVAELNTLDFVVTDSGCPTGLRVELGGTAVAYGVALLFSPSSLDFGGQVIGTTSAGVEVTLANAGDTAANLLPPAIAGDYAILATSCGASLAAGATCTITVSFTPTAVGVRDGTLGIFYDPGVLGLGLKGTGTKAPQAIAFGLLPDRAAGTQFTVSAIASSGLAVSFSSLTPPACTVSGSVVTLLSAGTCSIAANQAGDGTRLAAPQVARTFAVTATLNPADAIAIGAGGFHTCALLAPGDATCWGYNFYGQVGDGTTTDRPTPAGVTGLSGGVLALSTGPQHNCALTPAGGVKCWGNNQYGQVGDGSVTNRLAPVDVPGLASGVVAVAAGSAHTCAVTAAGGVKCWGNNQYGQVGDGSVTNRLAPVDVPGLASGVVAVAAGSAHTCAFTAAGGVKCWGNNGQGQLGDGSVATRLTPVDVAGLASGAVAVSAGSQHTCALMVNGNVKCWGFNYTGQLGDGTSAFPDLTPRLTPVNVVGLAGAAVAIAAGADHTCALTASGGVKCWGYNFYGQVGAEPTTNRGAPVDVTGLANGVVAIAAGFAHSCALTAAGGVKCWGNNQGGQLGDGVPPNPSAPYRTTPAFVLGLPGIDVSPDAFSFAARPVPVDLGTPQFSSAAVPAGYYDPAPVTVSGGEYSIGCSASYTSVPGTITPGQSVCVRHVASAYYANSVTTTLDIGGVTGTFTTTTVGAPPGITASPASLSFGNVAVGTTSAGQAVTIANAGPSAATGLEVGVNGDFAITATTCGATLATGASCNVTIAFTPSAVGTRADELLVIAGNLPTPLAVPVVGHGTASDVTPDAFSFIDQFLVPTNAIITSAPVQVTGLASAAPVWVIGGTYAVSSANNCSGNVQPFTANPGSIANGRYVCVRHTTSAVPGGSNDTQLIVGGLGDTFTTVTIDTVPAPFGFAAVSGVQPATTQASGAAAIVGINAPAPVSVTDGEYSLGCTGTWTSTAGTVANGQTVCVRHVAAPGYGSTTTTALIVGGVTGSFVTTTAPATSIPRLANISTRMQVLTGNDVMIGGFIIGGSVPKTVVVRARGPSLIPFGIPNALANPRMDLYADQTIIATNDDWQAQTVPADVAAITASGFAPTNDLESAIHTTLSPGAYTAVVSGVGNGTGVGIVEVFEVNLPEIPLINISTRGQVLLVNDVMIGGFIIQGDAPQTVVIRARGPSLVPFGIPNALLDPVLQLFDGQTPIATNDNWQAQTIPAEVAAIQASGFAPTDTREAVIRITLPPGAYTAIVTGKNGTTGVGIVEVFAQ